MSDNFEDDDFEGDDFEDNDFEDDDSESRVRYPSIDELLSDIKSGRKDEVLETVKTLRREWIPSFAEKLARSEGDKAQRLRFDLTVMMLTMLNYDIDHHIDYEIAEEIAEGMEQEALEDFSRAFELARALGYDMTFDFSQPRGPEYAQALLHTLEEAQKRIPSPELPLLVAAAQVNLEYYAAIFAETEILHQMDAGFLQKLADALSETALLNRQAPSDTLDVIAQALQHITQPNRLPPPSRG
jgi:hypothetical protein